MLYNDPHKTYTSPQDKRDFRVVSVGKHQEVQEKWIDGVLKFYSEVVIQFLDNKERITLVYDFNDKLIKKIEWNKK